MRDFRNAKAMAQTLRAALATKGVKITIGQSLELIAEIFGVADWNTLAAAIPRGDIDFWRKSLPTTARCGQ
jgi:glyoxalase superfamily protein